MCNLRTNSEINKQYWDMCEAVAYEVKENTLDYDMYVDDLAQDTVKAIKTQNCISDFEKTVRDYFKENELELNCEKLAEDIKKFL